ncbi:MAG: glycosyltransferase [Bacteroidaceae bacterium]|nr:glycosyltransferase [Bacteroidaceae bacterium]
MGKKIIIVGPAWPYRGGIAAFSERLARQLVNEGNSVLLYTFTLQYPSFLFPGKTQFSDDPAPEGLTVYRRFSSVNPFSWLKAGREMRRQRPDVVVFAYWMSFMAPCFGTIASCLRRDKHICLVGLMHNMIPHEPNIMDKVFPGYFVNRMHGFLALSEAVTHDISRFDHKDKPKLFRPHPVYDHYGELLPKSEARQLLKLDEEGRYVLFFGFIRAYKGLDLLLEAMSDERLERLGVKLIVAGEFYEDEQPYREKISALHLDDRVLLSTQFIPNAEVNRYFSACDIVAQPYRTATQSGVTQIAFHFAKPMLVTDVGGLAEIVPNGKIGYVVPPEPAKIADGLADFYENDRETTFIENTKEEKKKYAWSNVTEALYEIVRQTKGD